MPPDGADGCFTRRFVRRVGRLAREATPRDVIDVADWSANQRPLPLVDGVTGGAVRRASSSAELGGGVTVEVGGDHACRGPAGVMHADIPRECGVPVARFY